MIAYTRRDILTMLGSAVLGGCATSHPSPQSNPSPLDALADQLEAESTQKLPAGERLLNYETDAAKNAGATLTPELRAELQLDALRKTPLVPRTVVVSYETESHPDVPRRLLEQALPFVRDFYLSYQIDITFVPVQKLEPSMIKLGSSFGMQYTSLDKMVHDYDLLVLGYYVFPHQRDAVFRYVGSDHTVPSRVAVKLKKFDEEFQTSQYDKKKTAVYRHLRGLSFASAGRTFVRTEIPLTGDRNDVFDLACTIAHEFGHIWGLYHINPFSFDGTLPFSHTPDGNLVNLMFIDPHAPHISSQTAPLGAFLAPLQVALIHNYFSGGVVFREVIASQIGYQSRLKESNPATPDHLFDPTP